jgi:hypothetical protein
MCFAWTAYCAVALLPAACDSQAPGTAISALLPPVRFVNDVMASPIWRHHGVMPISFYREGRDWTDKKKATKSLDLMALSVLP